MLTSDIDFVVYGCGDILQLEKFQDIIKVYCPLFEKLKENAERYYR